VSGALVHELLLTARRCSAETVARKLRELRIAGRVLQEMTRSQLLAAYLNAAYFDHQAYGVQAASEFYFSAPAGRLSLPQAAMLAGLVENRQAAADGAAGCGTARQIAGGGAAGGGAARRCRVPNPLQANPVW
jgi:hypothetical protein